MAGKHLRKSVRLSLGAGFFLLALFGCQAFAADPLGTWHVRSFAATSDLNAVTYADGVYVAVGYGGVLTTSRDRVGWTAQPLVTDSGVAEPCLYAVTHGNGLFVAVGTYIWTSPDGVTWTHRPCPVQEFGGVAYGNGRFVAGGGTGGLKQGENGTPGLATSEDGITWVDRSRTSGVTSEPTMGLVFAAGKFVQLGWHQPPYYSTDGLTWFPAQSAAASLYNHGVGLAYGNGVFVAVGNTIDLDYGGTVMWSPDGVNWERTTGPAFRCICFGNGMFMATGSNTATPPPYSTYTSTDGVTWTEHQNGAAGNGIVASPGAFTLAGGSMSIATTSDGETWTAHSGTLPVQGTAAAYGNGLFVTVGTGGKIYTSPDGAAWTERSGGSLSGKSFKSVVYGPKGFVAAGSDSGTGAPSVAVSADGVDWADASAAGSPSTALASGGGIYVGVSGSTVYSSADGRTWTARAVDPDGPLNGAAFGDGKFVMVGDRSTATSADGLAWTFRASGSRLVAVAAGDGLFAAVGDNGETIRVSPDGLSWSDSASGVSPGALTGIAYGYGRFVAVGAGGSESDSPDGVTWTARSRGASGGASRAITFGNGTFVAVSNDTILQSDPLPEPASREPASPTPVSPDPLVSDGGESGGGCFVATAAFGGDFAWQVRTFKEFRDRRLLAGAAGRAMVRLYYAASPPLAAFIAGRPGLRAAARAALTPMAYGIRYPGRAGGITALCLLACRIAVRCGKRRKDKK